MIKGILPLSHKKVSLKYCIEFIKGCTSGFTVVFQVSDNTIYYFVGNFEVSHCFQQVISRANPC